MSSIAVVAASQCGLTASGCFQHEGLGFQRSLMAPSARQPGAQQVGNYTCPVNLHLTQCLLLKRHADILSADFAAPSSLQGVHSAVGIGLRVQMLLFWILGATWLTTAVLFPLYVFFKALFRPDLRLLRPGERERFMRISRGL